MESTEREGEGSAGRAGRGGTEAKRLFPVRNNPRAPAVPAGGDQGIAPVFAQAAIAFSQIDSEELTPELTRVFEDVRRAVDTDAMFIGLLDARGETFATALESVDPRSRIKPAHLLGRKLEAMPELHRQLAISGGYLQMDDCLVPTEGTEREADWFSQANIRACVLISLHGSDGPIGFAALACEDAVRWQASFCLILRLLGASLAAGVERLRVARRLASVREREELEALTANDGVWDFDERHKQTHFSPRWKKMLGYREDELDDNVPDWRNLVHPEDYAHVQAKLKEHLDGRTDVFESVHRLRHRDGHWIWVQSRAKASGTGQHRHKRLVGVELDITERKHYEEALRREKESVLITLQSIGDGVIRTDSECCVEYLNPVAEDLTGWSLDDALGRPIDQLFRTYHEETCEPLENPLALAIRQCRSIKSIRPTLLIRTSDYRELFIESTASPIRDRGGAMSGGVLVFHDVSESRELQRRLTFHASHDVLTGLVNRHEFEQRLETALDTVRAGEGRFALCVIDIDQFRVINDNAGHTAGDALLAQLGALLKTKVRWRDTPSRLGGDQFGVLMEGATLDEAMRAAEAFCEEVRGFRFSWDEHTYSLRVSVGIVPITGESETVASLLAAADVACQAAKDAGRDRVHAYQVNDVALMSRRREMQWVARLTTALEENRFDLYRQSIRPLTEHAEQGQHFELLLRLRDEDGGMPVSPARFIRAAERFNITPSIDRWVINRAFRWLLANPQELDSLAVCSINLSAQSLADDKFLPYLMEQLDSHKLPGEKFCFEITETAAVASYAQAQRFITGLRQRGCRFALDDFGSGMASFAHLRHLPVDYVKIDGSFVRNIENDTVDRSMVVSINDICHLMGKRTIAEFAESDAICQMLREIGVDYAQGYAMDEPTPIS
ncbi:MAG: EAL domain-containing protein [Pseudomonadota bacterium]